MKKVGLLSAFLMGMLFLFSGAGAAEGMEKRIVIQDGEEGQALQETALIDKNEILIPVGIIEPFLYHDITVDRSGGFLAAEFSMLKFRVADSDINRQLVKRTALQFPVKTVNGEDYVDAGIAAKVFGFTAEEMENQLVIKPDQYNLFRPLPLPKPQKAALAGKVVMAWQPTFEGYADLSKIEKVKGLNVAAPSWLAVTDEAGSVRNQADYRYVKEAHERGYQVWPLVTNSFDPDLTHVFLSEESARKNVIKQLVVYAALYEFDGINIDFENVYDSDRELLNVFVKELADAMRRLDLTVSIDVTVPSGVSQWSLCYDRRTLAEAVDFVMLMAYDEHWRTSPVSGSVASIGWVESGLARTLAEVPAHKLVLGVPFYMREWREDEAGGVQAKTMTMAQAEAVLAQTGIEPMWLEESGQYYFEYQKENDAARYRVWQEEARSIGLKADLINKYHLAGVAAWRKGFEKPEIWDAIYEKLQPADNPEQKRQDMKKKKHRKHK